MVGAPGFRGCPVGRYEWRLGQFRALEISGMDKGE